LYLFLDKVEGEKKEGREKELRKEKEEQREKGRNVLYL
jgi:hypothetical protein